MNNLNQILKQIYKLINKLQIYIEMQNSLFSEEKYTGGEPLEDRARESLEGQVEERERRDDKASGHGSEVDDAGADEEQRDSQDGQNIEESQRAAEAKSEDSKPTALAQTTSNNANPNPGQRHNMKHRNAQGHRLRHYKKPYDKSQHYQ